MKWVVCYEIPPMRAIHKENVLAASKGDARHHIEISFPGARVLSVFDAMDPDRNPRTVGKENKFA